MSKSKPARTRVAPSPTGDPHVGTAYMALFNRALADKTGGQFIFRLDDTDQARRDESSEQKLYEALAWLELRPEESPDVGGPHAPYRQSERLDIYKKYIDRMLEEGTAYRCFATPEELETMRKIQQKEGRSPGYDRRWRDRPDEDVKAELDAGKPFVVRVKMPLEGEVVFNDLMRGPIRISHEELDDKVIWKADGFPTYHFANVVDDHEFEITHVIRGEEWIASVPTHIVLMEALGFTPPIFIHMPLLRNSDKSKVSKRKNPTSLMWFRDAGMIREGLLNFLALMGYSLGDDREIFSYEEFAEHIQPERISLGGPVFDLQKLEWCNGEHMRRLSYEDLEARLLKHFEVLAGREADFQPFPEGDPVYELGTFADKFRIKTQERNLLIAQLGSEWAKKPELIRALIPLIWERVHTLSEAADYLPPFFEELPALPLEDISTIKKFDTAQVKEALAAARSAIDGVDFAADDALEQLEKSLRTLVDEKGWKVGPVFMSTRLAALRAKISPPLFESMLVLGKDVTLKRMDDAIAKL